MGGFGWRGDGGITVSSLMPGGLRGGLRGGFWGIFLSSCVLQREVLHEADHHFIFTLPTPTHLC